MAKKTKKKPSKQVATLTHADDKRANIPTAEFESVLRKDDQRAVEVRYARGAGGAEDPLADEKAARNRDLDPQLVWRGKDEQDWSDLVVHAPPLFIQEKVHPKALVDDLLRRTKAEETREAEEQAPTLFADLYKDFNGVPEGDAKTEFYQHEANWTNRMILGDSLQVMASLAEREGLRGKVQCIYFDPPYGIKFNSNFQWSTTSRDVKDGNAQHITREPEQVKAFRDTWRDGIHSYLTYLRDRLMVARELLSETGSLFLQIGDDNVHLMRCLLDEVFGSTNFVSLISFVKTQALGSAYLPGAYDYILWYGKDKEHTKYRNLLKPKSGNLDLKSFGWKSTDDITAERMPARDASTEADLEKRFRAGDLSRQGASEIGTYEFYFQGSSYWPSGGRRWASSPPGMARLSKSSRIQPLGKVLSYRLRFRDFPVMPLDNGWHDTYIGTFTQKTYVVQTGELAVQRCLLMATDPGDLVLDPTCGSGTTATVAEQWGRRWITVDTSRVSLALARARVMGARYPFYLLADTKEGAQKEAQVTRTEAPDDRDRRYAGNIRHGFVYERVPHITLKAIANNTEIDVIWERSEAKLALLRARLTKALPAKWLAEYRKKQKYTADVPADIQEWEIPRERPESWPKDCQPLLDEFWELRIARQKEIDASIAAKAEFEYLYDKPYEDKKKVRVAGPFTVESLSPHRMLGVDEDDELIDPAHPRKPDGHTEDTQDFAQMILENLRTAGVQQAHKEDRIAFSSLSPWPGEYICAEGRYSESGGDDGEHQKRAGIFIGPEFGTVGRQHLVQAAREAGDAGFDVLIACAFNYEAHASEFGKLGRIPVLKATMNADLHMAGDLKNTGKGNLFVIFGEPDIDVLDEPDGRLRVRINGVDVFDPSSGEVRSDGADGIACWMIDTDYNEESFFVRHAYFLGQNDPYKSLKTTLKAEINEDAWATLHSDTSRPFDKPHSGRIAVKVINHLGDEVMKVFRVE